MNRKISALTLMCFLLICVIGVLPAIQAEAASEYNLVEKLSKQKSKTGKWKQKSKGTKYRYSNGKYVKNKWLKVEGRFYYFNKKGYRITGKKNYKGNVYFLKTSGKYEGSMYFGWKTVQGKRYYFSKETGAALTGWQNINADTYYFNEKGVMAKKCSIDGIKIDSKGRADIDKKDELSTASKEVDEQTEIIFMGDSRTVGLGQIMGGDAQYIGKVGEGFSWLEKTAVKEMKKRLSLSPSATVILNFGINDLHNITNYIQLYKKLMKSYPKAKFYMVSVNPIEEKLAKSKGYVVKNKQIAEFNQQMQSAFLGNYIDTYSYLMNQGYIKSKGKLTADGIHYTAEGYQIIYQHIMSQL